MINGDAESQARWTSYVLTQLGIGIIGDKGLSKAGLILKGGKVTGGPSTFTKGVTLIKEINKAVEILNSLKKDMNFAFAGNNKIAKVPQNEIDQAYYKFANTKISSAEKRKSPGTVTSSFNLDKSLGTQTRLMYNGGSIGVIPKEVRDKLVGKEFKSFDEFRAEFWKTVADSSYANEFNQMNIKLMKDGRAPFCPKTERYGKQKYYVLHHKQPIHQDGEVYDLDNLIIVSPKMHQTILDPKYHFGKKG